MKRALLSLFFLITLPLPFAWGQKTTPQEIVGGTVTTIDQVPWQAMLTNSQGALVCGGAIISGRWIITAAHCVAGKSPSDIKIYTGVTFQDQKSSGTLYNVESITIHPSYNNSNYQNDIALLRTTTEIATSANVQLIDVASYNTVDGGATDVGNIATVSGWGRISSGGPTSNQLRKVDVPIASNTVAASQYNGTYTITDDMLPAGQPSGGVDACQGDSGGPLTVRIFNGTPVLAGIVSFGIGCADPNYLGIYTRVSSYCVWITSVILPYTRITASINSCSQPSFGVTENALGASQYIRWDTDPRGLFTTETMTGTGRTFTPTVRSGMSGFATITALLPCSGTTISQRAFVGGPPPLSGSFYNSSTNTTQTLEDFNYVPAGNIYVTLNNPIGYTASFQPWQVSAGAQSWFNNNNNLSAAFILAPSYGPQVTVNATTSCGTSTRTFRFYAYGRSGVTFMPNPANDELLVEDTTESERSYLQKRGTEFEASLYNSMGKMVKYDKNSTGKIVLRVRDLPEGFYNLKIKSKNKISSEHIQIRH